MALQLKEKVVLVQLRTDAEDFGSLPKFVRLKPRETAVEREKRRNQTGAERLFAREGSVDTSGLLTELEAAKFTLKDVSAELRLGNDARDRTIITGLFVQEAGGSNTPSPDTDERLIFIRQRLAKWWNDIKVARLPGNENGPAVTFVCSGEIEPWENRRTLNDLEADKWGLKVHRAIEKPTT